MLTLIEILQRSTAFLQERGVEDAKLSTEWLIADALGMKRLDLYLQFERPLKEDELARIRSGVKRRANREPLQYILGHHEFYGVDLKVDSRALIPRPETEYLIQLLEERMQQCPPQRVLDLGTGTGAIALALASVFPESRVLAVDQSDEALSLARENGEQQRFPERVEFLQSDWFSSVEGSFDLIVSNPPYLTEEEMETAEPEVTRYEPHTALLSGKDGLDDIRRLFAVVSGYLNPGAVFALETGIAQHDVLVELAEGAGLVDAESVKDLQRRPRFFFCRQPA